MAAIDLKQLLQTASKNQFWEDFEDVWSEELELFRTEVLNKKYLFNVREQNDIIQLLEIGKTLSFNIDRSIDTSINYLKNNIKVITNKIKHKTTYVGYHYLFSLALYYGQVYNYFINNNIFTRGIDQTSIITNLNAILDYSLPFIGFTPELYYKSQKVDFLTLDEDPTWYLDENTYPTLDPDLQIAPTIHLAIEYIPQELLTIDSVEYLMNVIYLDYLLTGSLYNKKVTEYPHCGVQINCLMHISGYYDNLSNSTYSTPALKLNCATTEKNYFNQGYPIFLDIPTGTEGNMDLDTEVVWQLDQGTGTVFAIDSLEDLFSSVEFGDSSKGIMSKNFPYMNSNLILYYDCDETIGATIYDNTASAYNATLSGSYTREQKIIGGSIKYSGGYAQSGSNIYIQPTKESISFWVNGNLLDQTIALSNKIHLININGYDIIGYDISTKYLYVASDDTKAYYLNLLDGIDHLFTVCYDWDNLLYYIYIDGTLIYSGAILIAVPPTASNYSITIGQYFIGNVDEIRFYSKLLTLQEIAFLYSSRLGNIDTLGNLILSRSASDKAIIKKIEDTNWYIITARLDYRIEIQNIIDNGGLSSSEKIDAIAALEEEIVTINEVGIRDINGVMKVYANFPSITLRKKHHIAFNFLIKK